MAETPVVPTEEVQAKPAKAAAKPKTEATLLAESFPDFARKLPVASMTFLSLPR